MGLKRYIFSSIIFIALVGFYVNSLNSEPFTINIVGLPPISLSVAIWITIPLLFLFLASLFHMIFYSFKNYIVTRTQKKDMENFKIMIENKILNRQTTHYNFLTESFKEVGELCSLLKFDENKSNMRVSNEDVNNFLKLVDDIHNGKVVDLKKYKLSPKNPLSIQNQENLLKKEPKRAKEIIQDCEDLNSNLCREALLKFVTFANRDEIKSLKHKISKREFNIIIDRYIRDEIDLNIEDINYFLGTANYNSKDFIELAKKLKQKLSPDATIIFFDKLYAQYPDALEAYLYLLFELQKIDTIREIIEDCDNRVCQKYRHLLFLRDNGKEFHIELFT